MATYQRIWYGVVLWLSMFVKFPHVVSRVCSFALLSGMPCMDIPQGVSVMDI